MSNEPFLPVKEIARIAGVHPVTVRRWIYRGWLKGIKLGGSLRVREEDFQEFFTKPRTAAAGE